MLRFPVSIRGAVGAGKDDGVAVGIVKPAFPVVWPAVAIGRIAMAWEDDVGSELRQTSHGGIEVVHFKPEQHAVAVRLIVRIAKAAMMMLDVKVVQLED